MNRIPDRRGGLVLIFVVAILALMSVLAVVFVRFAGMERGLGGNFAHQTAAQLAAESGVQRALQMIDALPARPVPETVLRDWTLAGGAAGGDGFLAGMPPAFYLLGAALSGGGELSRGYALTIADESGKLNLNDDAGEAAEDEGAGRVERVAAIALGAMLQDTARGEDAAAAMFHKAPAGRDALPDGRFADMQQVEKALLAAGLQPDEIDSCRAMFTVDTWQDPNVIRVDAKVRGPEGAGVALRELDGVNLQTWLSFQTCEFMLQPRSPVNLNTARVELLQGLVQPIQGAFLAEGPAENQSSEHYGWWSTGFSWSSSAPYATGTPEADPMLLGTVQLTKPFSDAQAAWLAAAMHGRIHGVAVDYDENGEPDLTDEQQTDGDGDGKLDPNPFETWEEFRHFLDHGFVGSETLEEGTPAHAIFVGDGFAFEDKLAEFMPKPLANWRDPLTMGFTEPSGPQYYNPWKVSHSQQPAGCPWSMGNAQHVKSLRDWYRRYFAAFQRDALEANFNPNSRYNDWNPNRNLYLGVDKAQLTTATTEGCFTPTGRFRVNSLGTVAFGEDRIAETEIECVVEAWTLLRQTSQAQFLRGVDVSGGGSNLDAYVSEAPEPATAPYGYAHATPGGMRLSLQCYPEPLFANEDAADWIHAAACDGYWLPATTELKDGAFYEQAAAGHLNGILPDPLRLNAFGLAGSEPVPGQTDEYLANAQNRPHAGRLQTEGVENEPGNLYPDGAYCENGRALAYRLGNCSVDLGWLGVGSGDNTRGLEGKVGFWLKPNFHTGISTRIRKFFCGPSRYGVLCNQQYMALYYFANPCSDEENGIVSTRPQAKRFSARPYFWDSPLDSQGGHYGYEARNCWTPTHSVVFGFAWQGGLVKAQLYQNFLQGSHTSRTVTRDYPLSDRVEPGNADQPPLESHQWTYFMAGWELYAWPGNGMGSTARLGMNEKSELNLADPAFWYFSAGRDFSNPYWLNQNFYADWNTEKLSMQWLRFGELPRGGSDGDPDYAAPQASPYGADATIDEIRMDWTLYHDQCAGGGRYLSPADDSVSGIATLGMYSSPMLRLGDALGADAVRLRGVQWTVVRPRSGRIANAEMEESHRILNNYRGVKVNVADGVDPMSGHWAEDTDIPVTERQTWDAVSVDFRDAAGDWYWDNHGGVTARFTDPAGSELQDENAGRFTRADEFQYRFTLHMAPGQVLYEAPALDDITFIFAHAHARVLVWRVLR